MASLNNIEKLIQMATIEHMYEMLQKLKNDISINQLSDTIFESSNPMNFSFEKDSPFLQTDILKDMNNTISDIKTENVNIKKLIDSLVIKINNLETELKELKIKNEDLSSELKKSINNNGSIKDAHITLKIEEKNINTCGNLEKIKQLEEEVEEEEVEESVVEEAVVEEAVVEEAEEAEEEEEEDEEVEEEEVGTDEEDIGQKEQNKTNEPLEENDEEEVFEIEIDDISYFATDEENGILYEVTTDGEVGKKVGIIKNGEPIFS